jgi:two-component system KDP operon response regulator KdpE
MTVLVVEDEVYVADLIQVILEDLGNSCVLARNAFEAERLLDAHIVDAMTLDLGLPDRHGLDLLESVGDSRPDLARSTLVITGMPLEPPTLERVARHGASLLAKPFTVDALQEAFRSQVGREAAVSGTPD